MERYEGILINGLELDTKFLHKNCARIRGRLLAAYESMVRRDTDMVQDDIFAINQCLHLAGSIVLLGSREDRITRMLEDVKADGLFSTVDPTMVLSACALRYILKDQVLNGALTSGERDKLQYIINRFQGMNWLVGLDAMNALGLNRS